MLTGVGLLSLVAPVVVAQSKKLPGDDAGVFLQFGAKLEKTLTTGDHSFFDQSMDVDALLGEVTKGINVPTEFRAGFGRGFKSTFNLGSTIGKGSETGGSYKLLRYHAMDGKPRLVFRLVTDGAVTYHDLLLRRAANGEVRIVDVFVFNAAELLSQTMPACICSSRRARIRASWKHS